MSLKSGRTWKPRKPKAAGAGQQADASSLQAVAQEHWKNGSPQDFVKAAILRGFHDSLDYDEFEVGHGQPLGLQQKVSEVLVATTTVDQ